MIKCCAFGTVRIHIHVYKEYGQLSSYEETKVDEMALQIGGSVYNTVAVLNALKQDTVFYTLNTADELADFIKARLKKEGIPFIINQNEHSSTAVSIIFVDSLGKKKMVSYDGARKDSHILNKLRQDISNYDLFYTSFYEINKQNIPVLAEIMQKSRQCFIDLSPLIYEVDSDIVNQALSHVQILSGTSDEYDLLLGLMKIGSIEQLIEKYNFKYVFVKKGSKGAALYYNNRIIECKPDGKKASRDTTGCGDTFNAGVIYSLSKNTSEADMLKNAVNFATLVAYQGFNPSLFAKIE